jgi:hypothetical protein
MELPHRYPYNPKWRPLGGFLAVGAGLCGLACLSGHLWQLALMGAAFLLLGLLGTVRCVVLRRYLELGQDAVLLQTGFLHRQTTSIPYEDIEWLQEAFILKNLVCAD